MMKNIIPAIPKEILKKELTKEKFLRFTNFGNNEIYVITAHDSPNLMKEVGRLREISFRAAGGGTGKETDIDKYDTAEIPYKQLIVWNQEDEVVVGGYRFIVLKNFLNVKKDDLQLATKGLFEFSDKFMTDYFPNTLELGRSFIQPDFQASGSGSRKTLFALDNLWDGLGAIVVQNPDIKYLFGKVTMYTHYDKFSRDLLLFFIRKYFEDKDKLVYPVEPISYHTNENILKNLLTGKTYKEDYKILSKEIRARGENIPPLINSYMNISPTMKCFGTSINSHFGDVEETGIMVTLDDIYDTKKRRHLDF